jgi:DnaJ-class molecular chaperone
VAVGNENLGFDRIRRSTNRNPVVQAAICRELIGPQAVPDIYPLVCDTGQAGSGVLLRGVIWQPPNVLFPCPTCNGTGRYVGLIEAGTCKVCGGRKVVAG